MILVAGSSYPDSFEFFVSRYLTTGTLDTSFGVDGKVYFDWPLFAGNRPVTVTAIAVGGDDGAIAIGGFASIDHGNLQSDYDIEVVRLSSTGQLDLFFGNNGVAIFGFNEVDEWTSSRTYTNPVGNLSAGWLKGTGPGVTVFDDNDEDRLIGSSGKDWFFANLTLDSNAGDTATKKDKIDDLGNSEFWQDIDFGLDL